MFMPILTLTILIVVFHFLFIYRLKISTRWWERVDYFWYGLGFFGILLAAKQYSTPQCALAQEIHLAYGETFISDNWLNGSVHYKGKVFPSWNYFIKEQSREDGVRMLEGEPSMIVMLSTSVLYASDNTRENPIASYDRFKYNYFYIWPYVLALGIALKVTKVSAKLKTLE